MDTATPLPSRPGRRLRHRRLVRAFAVALALTAVAGPAVAHADTTRKSGSIAFYGVRGDYHLMQASNGGLYFNYELYDTAVDGNCAHISFIWHHENGSTVYDGDYVCGYNHSVFFHTPTRNWTYYSNVSVRVYTEARSEFAFNFAYFWGDEIHLW